MKLTTERLKQIIREELENATDSKKSKIKFHKDKDGKFKAGPKPKNEAELDEEIDEATFRIGDPKTRNKPKIRFQRGPDGEFTSRPVKKIRKKEKPADFNLSGETASPERDALKGPTAAPEEETEFDRMKKMSDEEMYDRYVSRGLEERIFKMLVDKINGASK